jgi:Fe-S cluster assembly protein SufD
MNVAEKVSFKEQLLSRFNETASSLYGNTTMRRQAADSFARLGFPTRKTEDYKYIAPDTLFKKGFSFRKEQSRDLTAGDIQNLSLVKEAWIAVIVNGVFSTELSSLKNLPTGITVCSIAEAVNTNPAAQKQYGTIANAETDAFVALNTALNESGVFVHFAKNTVCEKSIHILHITDNETEAFYQSRNLILADENVQGTVIESFESVGPVKSFTNAVCEVNVAANAKLDHYRLQWESENDQLISTVQSVLGANSLYNTYTFTLGGHWVRNNLNIVLNGKNGEAHLYGLYLPDGNQIVDNHTIVDHSVPNCMSNELYKGVISGKSTAVFNGKIFVRPDAQKTNAFQTNRNILLSDDASINTKPQLEIYADDVKCSHGTSTGRIDEDALFYLRARGITESNARKLLIRAFAEEVVNQIKIEEIREQVSERMDHLLK